MELDRYVQENPLGQGSYICEVDVFNLVIYLNWTPKFVCN